MKTALGLLLILGGIAFGLYAGAWWAFVGGIVQMIGEIRAPELSAVSVAVGLLKVLCAGGIGVFSALVCIVPGLAMLKS